MRSILAAMLYCVFAAAAAAGECPGNPQALGTARTIVVDATEHTRIGTMQYAETLPLGPREVVLTFDDGPMPGYSARALDILAAECVKATFFIVGRQAQAFPQLVRRAYNEGHTIATHSQNHPRMFQRLSAERAIAEIEEGFASTGAALGDAQAVAPFFRVPGLRTSAATEAYLAARGVMVWSADFPADDWRRISAKQVMQRALDRLEAKGRGVLLLHDIQPATVLALPDLLHELKARGYAIVHVTASGPSGRRPPRRPSNGGCARRNGRHGRASWRESRERASATTARAEPAELCLAQSVRRARPRGGPRRCASSSPAATAGRRCASSRRAGRRRRRRRRSFPPRRCRRRAWRACVCPTRSGRSRCCSCRTRLLRQAGKRQRRRCRQPTPRPRRRR